MNRSMRRTLVVGLGAAIVGAACEEKKESAPRAESSEAGANVDKFATADPKLEKAIQAAASASAGAENGPPPEGIFAAGAADHRHAKGAPTTLEVVAEGDEPRVAISTPAPDTSRSYGPAGLVLMMQTGPRTVLPTTELRLALGPAKKDEGGPDFLVADVKRAATAKEQLGQLPPGTDKEIASLEGTQVRVQVTPDGRESDLRVQLGRSSHPELQQLAQSAAESIVLATIPLPPKPVGVGGQWIAETRMPIMSIDALAYRAYRVKSIDGDRLRLTLDVKAYAASPDATLPGVPPGSKFAQFVAEAHGEMELVRGESLARKADLQDHVVMVFEAPGASQPNPAQPGQPQGGMLTAQLQGQAHFVRGDDLRAALKP